MYLDYYQLAEEPFSITPDPRFLYYTRHHREAYDHLLYGITHGKGFIELTGEVGSGKSTLTRAVLAALCAAGDTHTALVLNPIMTPNQMLRAILKDFGVTPRGRDRLVLIEALNDFLLAATARGERAALFLDEAQNLSPPLMEQIRLLSNLETDQRKLLQIVLCGQPELKQRLARADLRQLRQRIQVRYHLPPLEEAELEAYITHRLRVAGAASPPVFAPRARRAIYRYTRGIPRLINAVCDHALLAGYVQQISVIELDCVRRAVRQLEGVA